MYCQSVTPLLEQEEAKLFEKQKEGNVFLSDERAKEFRRALNHLLAIYATLFPDKEGNPSQDELLRMQDRYGADHYQREHDLVLSNGEGCFVWDMAGKRYLDMNATYSAIAHGHGNIEIIGAMLKQAFRMTSAQNRLVNDMQPRLLKRIADLTGQDRVILMNTGAEAFDTAVKAARQWAYRVKKVSPNLAGIITAKGNFHGRTLAAIAASATDKYREDFGPFPPLFKKVTYGNIAALQKAIIRNTAAFIVEPIQGEGGIVTPPDGYLKAVRKLCTEKNILLIFDEIQTGLGRTGKLLAGDWEGVRPDGIILGKALGAYMPVSALAARNDIMRCFTPGRHGSTFGGTALSCATALKSLELLTRDDCALVRNSKIMGEYLLAKLGEIQSPLIKEVRGKGLFVGIEIDEKISSANAVFVALKDRGLLSGVAGNNTVRLTPPLVITKDEVDGAVRCITETLSVM